MMMREVLSWWLRQLAALLPARWRRRSPGAARDGTLLLTLKDDRTDATPSVEAGLGRRGRIGRLGRFTLDQTGMARLRASARLRRGGPVALLLPPRLLLEQTVSMPLAAERGLETALRWEMDRLTPFAADSVYWTWAVQRRDRQRATLDVALRLVPKASVEPVRALLAGAGLRLSSLVSAADPARAVPLDGAKRRGVRLSAVLLVLVACLLTAAVALPFVRQQRRMDRLEAQMAALRPQVEVSEALRQRIRERDASTDVFAAERARVGDALQAIATLTTLLPDDTFLIELGLRDRQLTLSGQSGGAARLIPILAADPAILNPVFAAPVTRNEMSGRQAFQIRAELRP